MKRFELLTTVIAIGFTMLNLVGCENTQVSGSVSYSMGTGYGYPMYYGGGYPPHSNMVVARPPRHERPRPPRPPRRH